MAPKLLAIQYRLTPPGIDPNKYGSGTATVEKIVGQVIAVLTIVAFVYFAFQIIFAGYSFFTSQGDKSRIETARKRLTEAVFGITIVIISMALAALVASLAGVGNIFDLNTMFLQMGL